MIRGIITEETRDILLSLADYMCGLVTDLNSMNFELFIKKREEYISMLDSLVNEKDYYDFDAPTYGAITQD